MAINITSQQAIGNAIVNDIGEDNAAPVLESGLANVFDFLSSVEGSYPINDSFIDVLTTNYNAAKKLGLTAISDIARYMVQNDSSGQTTDMIAESYLKQISYNPDLGSAQSVVADAAKAAPGVVGGISGALIAVAIVAGLYIISTYIPKGRN